MCLGLWRSGYETWTHTHMRNRIILTNNWYFGQIILTESQKNQNPLFGSGCI